jgi:ring-1,2-phenylacetyl-CoA epoxidase subunit PaaE
VSAIERQTPESVAITLDPGNNAAAFNYLSGQYLTFILPIGGESLHRSYSICSAPHENILRVAVKEVEGGRASTFLNRQLKVGDELKSMAPMGNFFVPFDAGNQKHYVFFAAGSGITPVISLIKSSLHREPQSKITLFYANKSASTTIFKDELQSLSTDQRFKLVNIYSSDNQVEPLFSGRINFGKTLELIYNYCNDSLTKEYFVCGPSGMIEAVSEALQDSGVQKSAIHFEYFAAPGQDTTIKKEPAVTSEPAGFEGECEVEVMLDDRSYKFKLHTKGNSVLDATLDQGADAPYSCKGGVCTTCRAKLKSGSVKMDNNFALTDGEMKDGYILTCQSHPTSSSIKVSYDE